MRPIALCILSPEDSEIPDQEGVKMKWKRRYLLSCFVVRVVVGEGMLDRVPVGVPTRTGYRVMPQWRWYSRDLGTKAGA